MIKTCTSQLGRAFEETEPGCGVVYDDARQWTICPHNPLHRAVSDKVCKQHDLFDCTMDHENSYD